MSDYWLKRSNELERLTQERTDETVKQVNEMYQTAIDTLRDRAKAVFDRYSKNGKLTEQQALKLLNMNQTKEYRENLLEKYAEAESEEEKKRLETVLDAPAYADRISRIEALANEIYSEALSFGTNEQVQIEKRLIAAYKHSYYKTTFDIQRYTGKYYDFEKLPSNRVKEAIRHKWLGKNYSERVWDNTDRTAEKLKDIIINGVMTGQSIGTMTDALEAAIGSTPDEGARYRFSRLIRTEVNFISGQATQKAYKEAGIGEYVFLATLDKRTCHDCGNEKRMSCAELDGKHFKLSEAEVGVNKHPMHPYCRCSDYPYIKGKKGTRSARDKNGKTILIPDDMTYSEWYEEYVEGEVDSNNRKMYNEAVDKEQYDKYKQKLPELANLKFEDFQALKHNNIDLWKSYKILARSKNYLQQKLNYVWNGEKCFIPKHTKFEKVVTIAGKGSDTAIRCVDRLVEDHGGKANEWQKRAGKIISAKYVFDLHWYERAGVQYEVKLKKRKERKRK